jgi:hypothetical protein
MSQPAWLNKYLTMKNEVVQIFEDLEVYEQFCRDYGYVYDERDLYKDRGAYAEFLKMKKGREPWDQWRTPKRREFTPRHNNHFNKQH